MEQRFQNNEPTLLECISRIHELTEHWVIACRYRNAKGETMKIVNYSQDLDVVRGLAADVTHHAGEMACGEGD